LCELRPRRQEEGDVGTERCRELVQGRFAQGLGHGLVRKDERGGGVCAPAAEAGGDRDALAQAHAPRG
jgi:hypothetical protein